MSATNVYNLHRALVGLYPLTTSFQNAKIKLFDVQKIESESIVTNLEGAEPGKFVILCILFDIRILNKVFKILDY